jgi:NitT/TauT family transport system substrate-binding protein
MEDMKWLRPILVMLTVVALAFTVTACGDDDEESGATGETTTETEGGGETQEVELLLSFPESVIWSSLLVARDQGYFEEEGLEVTSQETEGSGFVTQQVIAGNADYGWGAADSVIIAYARDDSLRAVMCHQEQNIFRIVTLADSDIQSVDDLAGKTLGFTEKGGGEEPLVRAALADAGITDEVRLLPIGAAGPQSRVAIEDGTVDAYASSYPDMSSLTAAGLEFRDITPDKFNGTPGDCLMTRDEVLQDPEKRKIVEGIARAWARGSKFTIDNTEQTLEIGCAAVPEECNDMEAARLLVEDTAKLLQPVEEGAPVGSLYQEGWQNTAQVLADTGAIEEPVDVTDLVASPEAKEIEEKILAEVSGG